MNKLTSIYLDLIRFTAALVVVLSHAAAFTSLKIPLISGLGTEAVVVFFVLSGYVIAYVSNNKENNYIVFFKARAIRIYSVLIPAILITFFFDHLGLKYNHYYYFLHPGFHYDYSILTVIKLIFLRVKGLISIWFLVQMNLFGQLALSVFIIFCLVCYFFAGKNQFFYQYSLFIFLYLYRK
ncbi:acyltransferase family protein [Klebsiella quasivariicola]|uniref:acyltransferase family protein n=1 Tax=Klebsiella quasivariicola TaxID=2026240 RepID=UPI00164310C0|nr:acyltransferase family protein [Klebsiella quasivariicola]